MREYFEFRSIDKSEKVLKCNKFISKIRGGTAEILEMVYYDLEDEGMKLE